MNWIQWSPDGVWVDVAALPNADPCLVWAAATEFADFRRPADAALQRVPVLAELVVGVTPTQWQAMLGLTGAVRPAYLSALTRYCSADLTPAAVRRFSAPGNPAVARLEMALPVLPRRAPPPLRQALPLPSVAPTPQAPDQTDLLAVIDNGCPWAHASFRTGMSSRLLNLWDQDAHPAFGVAPAVGGQPAGFGYGCSVDRSALNALLLARRSGVTSVNEDSAYELARQPELRRSATHGAQVLDQMIGPMRAADRMPDDVYSGRHGADRPPSFRRGRAQVSDRCDVVFVQLPRDAWCDPHGNALGQFVLDGLRYVLSCAGSGTRRVIVNISCAVYTGAHNGSGIMSAAIAELVDAERAAGRELLVFMPAGNAFDSRWHARGRVAQGRAASLRLRVPPGSESPNLVQVWLGSDLPGCSVSITSPQGLVSPPMTTGQVLTLSGPNGVAATAIYTAGSVRGTIDPTQPTRNAMLTLVVEPADSPDRAAGAGDWQIAVSAVAAADVQVYVARNEPELGMPLRARPAHLIDPAYDPSRYLRAAEDDPGGFAAATAPGGTLAVTRRGTIANSAIAPGVYCIAGLRRWPRLSAPEYASAGAPTPDAAAFCDESRVLPGLRGAGTRSGSTVRLRGTSFASPQIARATADGVAPVASPPHDPARFSSVRLPP